ncbi:flavin monoamine oxidase family protein [Winogradskyella pacifica]|uniref:flavin monoamine oxidase family protein n=1 Tax=Winogradskyella pacifica TaxID=664642 RepID=UPI0015CEAA44|nr:FAD-dependent oxidoreductase [Winogradskyella pacifica]
MNKSIVIIGAGLSGLYLGYLLKKAGFTIKIVEANDRIGGRIFTKKTHDTPVELGATWLWKYNKELMALCQELKLTLFEQAMAGEALFEATTASTVQRFKLPANQDISYRIAGGTLALLEQLAAHFSEDELLLNATVKTIKEQGNAIEVITEHSTFIADSVVSTMPPQLLVNSIHFPVALDDELVDVANHCHTWMKDSIKFAVVYKTPFWKKKGLSGTGFSHVGPFTEIYDHSDVAHKRFALMGFLNGNLAAETKAQREVLVKHQLLKFFGDDGENYLSYEEMVWSQAPLTTTATDTYLNPHANNGHPIFQNMYLNGKFIVAGSETSPSYGGYMEGAIYRGHQIALLLKTTFL